MNRQGPFLYAEEDGVQMLRLPYLDQRISMVVVLPDVTNAMAKSLAKFDASALLKFLRHPMHATEGKVAIPKVRLEFGSELKPSLQSLGMNRAFSASADFSGISPIGLYISSVIHKAHVDLDEEGTVAAATTGIAIHAKSMVIGAFQMIADPPFLFFIEDQKTHTILFMGTVNDPA